MKRSRLDRHAAAKRYENRLRAEGHHKYRRIGRNRKRSAKRHERDFGDKADWVINLPCVVCGAMPSDPHHHPTRAAGGTSANLVPLCASHHREYHNGGADTFQAKYRVDLTAEAEHYHAAWQERTDVAMEYVERAREGTD